MIFDPDELPENPGEEDPKSCLANDLEDMGLNETGEYYLDELPEREAEQEENERLAEESYRQTPAGMDAALREEAEFKKCKNR